MQTGAATVENSMEIPQKIKIGSAFWHSNPISGNISEGTQNTKDRTAFGPVISLLGLYPKNPESPIQKNLYTPMFLVCLLYTSDAADE